jgi:Domain of unknown function (DUF4260)
MATVLKLEELGQFLFGIFLFLQLTFSWWWFPAMLLTPDVGMVGYLLNNKLGAITYNIMHHKGLAIVVLLLGYTLGNEILSLTGIILFSHASMDRLLGYGLKYFDHFKHTHLGNLS